MPYQNLFPFFYSDQLEEKISAFEGIEKNMLMMGAGSSPLLAAAALYFSD